MGRNPSHTVPSPRQGARPGLQPPRHTRRQGACAERAGEREGTGSGTLGVWRPTRKENRFSIWLLSVLSAPSLLSSVRKRQVCTPNLTWHARTTHTSCIHWVLQSDDSLPTRGLQALGADLRCLQNCPCARDLEFFLTSDFSPNELSFP